MKAKSLIAVLGNRFGVRPPGYDQVAPTWPTLGDVDTPRGARVVSGGEAGPQGGDAGVRQGLIRRCVHPALGRELARPPLRSLSPTRPRCTLVAHATTRSATTWTRQVSRALSRGGIIDITTTGRKTGQPRRIEIAYHTIDGRIYITGMPRADRTRAWLLNLEADPHLTFT